MWKIPAYYNVIESPLKKSTHLLIGTLDNPFHELGYYHFLNLKTSEDIKINSFYWKNSSQSLIWEV